MTISQTYTPRHHNEFALGRSFCTIWQWLLACQGLWKTRYRPEELGISDKRIPLPVRDPFTGYNWKLDFPI